MCPQSGKKWPEPGLDEGLRIEAQKRGIGEEEVAHDLAKTERSVVIKLRYQPLNGRSYSVGCLVPLLIFSFQNNFGEEIIIG